MLPTQSWIDLWLAKWQELLTGESQRLLWVVGAFVVCGFVEHAWPAQRGQGLTGRLRNVLLGACFIVLGHAALAAWYSTAPLHLTLRPPAELGTSLWLLLGYVAMTDFLYYWYHRAQHRFRALWALHELHHADEEMNVTTSFRTWFLEIPIQTVLTLIPALWLFGGDRTALGLFPIVSTFFLLFAHWNVPLRLGPLTPVLCGPELHRLHHSRLPRHLDCNFAQAFPIYDVIFGTCKAPRAGEVPPTGTDELEGGAPVLKALLHPFGIWWSLVRPRAARRRR